MITTKTIEYLRHKRQDDLQMCRCDGSRRLVTAAYKAMLYLQTQHQGLTGEEIESVLLRARHPLDAIHRAEILLDTDDIP